jgi:hypothetical protein
MTASNALWYVAFFGAAVLGGYLVFHGLEAVGKAGSLEALFRHELYHASEAGCKNCGAGSVSNSPTEWLNARMADGAL